MKLNRLCKIYINMAFRKKLMYKLNLFKKQKSKDG